MSHSALIERRPDIRAVTQLFTGPVAYWTSLPDALLPLLNAGRVRVAVRLSEAQKHEMLTDYQKTVCTAFREASDATRLSTSIGRCEAAYSGIGVTTFQRGRRIPSRRAHRCRRR
jgi:outer membrane protein TolC